VSASHRSRACIDHDADGGGRATGTPIRRGPSMLARLAASRRPSDPHA